jgi:hypothetical protein
MKSDATDLILLADRATASISGFAANRFQFFHPGYVPNRPFSVLVLELAMFKHNDLNSNFHQMKSLAFCRACSYAASPRM